MEQLDTHIDQLKIKNENLDEDVKIKRAELERAEKRFESIQNIKPSHLYEVNNLEQELSYVYRAYVERIRNHSYLENQLDHYLKLEEEQNKSRKKELEDIQKKIIIYNDKLLHDENEELNAVNYYFLIFFQEEDEGDEDFYENYQKEAMNKNNIREQMNSGDNNEGEDMNINSRNGLENEEVINIY